MLASLGTLLSVLACSCDLCANERIRTLQSPDGTKEAVLFTRDCGAIGHIYTEVSIMPAGKRPTGPGNTLVIDSNNGAVKEKGNGSIDVDVQWKDSDHLIIQYPDGARSIKKLEHIGTTAVVYQHGDAKSM
jgi:hypothetical protein